MKRQAVVSRKTGETDINLGLNLDDTGGSKINSSIPFLDHMLTLFSKHGSLELKVDSKGDIEVDYHHLTEDLGICLGSAMKKALGSKKGINRYGSLLLPMDESLVLISVDLSGRPYLYFDVPFKTEKIGEFDSQLVEEFFRGVVNESKITLHMKLMWGVNSHHISEALFKGFGRAIKMAVKIEDNDEVPSTKGIL